MNPILLTPLVLLLAPSAEAASADALDRLEAALQSSPELLHQHLDRRAFSHSAEDADRDTQKDVARWVRHRAPAGILYGQVEDAGDRMSRVSADDGQLIVRFLQDDGSVDYLDVTLSRRGRIADWTWLSDGVSATQRISDAAQGGEDGLTAMRALQGDVPTVESRRATAAEALRSASDQGVSAALAAVRASFPGQVWPDLVVLDRQLTSGAWDQVSYSLDRIDRVVGGDPWVRAVRGLVAGAQGDEDTSRALLASAKTADPQLANTPLLPGYAPHGGGW